MRAQNHRFPIGSPQGLLEASDYPQEIYAFRKKNNSNALSYAILTIYNKHVVVFIDFMQCKLLNKHLMFLMKSTGGCTSCFKHLILLRKPEPPLERPQRPFGQTYKPASLGIKHTMLTKTMVS